MREKSGWYSAPAFKAEKIKGIDMITLDAIKAEQVRLAAMIAEFKQQKTFLLTVPFPADLREGEKVVAAIITPDGTRSYWLILMPGEREKINYGDAMEWASSIGGSLPDRVDSALLFATMKDEFKPEWYWTGEQHASDSLFAWGQYFLYGNQSISGKSFEGRARAVRRLPI